MNPYVTVIIPTYNRPHALRRCLDSLAQLKYPRDRFELIVVDDGGSHPLAPILESLPPHITRRLLSQPNAGPAAARNHGARCARGDLLAFIDDDCAAAPGWLHELATLLRADPSLLVGGPVRNSLDRNVYATASQLLVDYLHIRFRGADGEPSFLTSNNLALARTGFEELGGFDLRFRHAAAEDRDLCARWRAHGWHLAYAAEAVVHHAHDLALPSFWRQHFGYGRGAHTFRHGRSVGDDVDSRFEPFSFYTGLIRYPYRHAPFPRSLLLIGLMLLSQAATVSGYLFQSLFGERRERDTGIVESAPRRTS